jgi:hypothetical protein
MATGIDTQVGFADETTPGTPVTPTLFLPVIDEQMTNKVDHIDSKSIIAGQRLLRSTQWAAGKQDPSGAVNLELQQRNLSLILKHMFGAQVVAGAGPYTHTASFVSKSGKAFTLEVGKPSLAGVKKFTYAGCKTKGWTIEADAGAIATLSLDIVAMSETVVDGVPTTASYPGTLTKPFVFQNGSLTVAGSDPGLVKKLSLKATTPMDDGRFGLGSVNRREPLENDLVDVVCTIDTEFTDLTQYSVYTGATEVAMVLNFTSGSNSLVITANVRADGATPQGSGRGILTQSIPFKVIGSTTDASGLTAVLTNSDSA